MTAHYRSQLNFTLENLKNAEKSYERLKNITAGLKDDKKINKNYIKRFEKAINDDLDIPKALSVLWKLVRDKGARGKIKTIKKMDEVFGLDLLKKEKLKVPEKVKKLVKKREKLRKQNKWKEADKLREKIKSLGFYVDDTPEGAKVRGLK